MHPTDLQAFTSETKARVRMAFGLDPEMALLSDWHAFTFACSRAELPLICRITPASHQSAEAIAAELEWQHFVIDRAGIQAPRALPSIAGRQIETFEGDGTSFTAVVFERLTGRPITAADWNDQLFTDWGRLVGRLHSVSMDFRPNRPRLPWHSSEFLNVDAYIPESLGEIRSGARQVIADVKRLPALPGRYGMIHGDVYQDNLLLSPGGLQLFDFDLCEYGFYASDIAVSLYAALWRHDDGMTVNQFARRFLDAFLTGYSKEFNLPDEELRKLPLFLRLREVLIYIVARKKRELNTLSAKARRFLEERGSRIARGQPIVEVLC